MKYKFKPLYEYEVWTQESFTVINELCSKYNLSYKYDTILTAEEAILLKLQCPYLDFIEAPDEV